MMMITGRIGQEWRSYSKLRSRRALVSSQSVQSVEGWARSFSPSCLGSYLCIRRFCSEPLDIDVF